VTYDAIVVGAGPAGSAAATVLAERGARVLLLEKDRFPRRKVCGEFLSGSSRPALDRLGVRKRVEAIAPAPIETGILYSHSARPIAFRLPAPALGISRERLDALLAERAVEAGAELREGGRVVEIGGSPGEGFRVRIASTEGEQMLGARAVVGAWGRWDSLDRSLEREFLSEPRYFGWSLDYGNRSGALEAAVSLYVFPGGYCGLAAVEGGVVRLAGVFSERSRRRVRGGWETVLERARCENAALDRDLEGLAPAPGGFLGTVPIVFTAKPPTERGMLLVGDAAGVIDPFSGEGQAAALSSGILAGEIASRFLRGEVGAGDYPSLYEAAWRRRFGRRFVWSALLRRLILHPMIGDLAGRIAGRRLVRLAVGALQE
jgi:flavin-dependent dehydrogenase